MMGIEDTSEHHSVPIKTSRSGGGSLSSSIAEPLRPLSLTMRGKQALTGIWYDGSWLSSEERRARVIEEWSPGCSVYDTSLGPLLLFSERRFTSEPFVGRPVIEQRGWLSTLTLTHRELDQLEQPEHLHLYPKGQLLYLHQGQLNTLSLEELTPIHPADWLSLPPFSYSNF